MKTSTFYVLSAFLWLGGSLYFDAPLAAVVAAFAHFLSWQIHVLEIKLNKLLDAQSLHVSQQDLDS